MTVAYRQFSIAAALACAALAGQPVALAQVTPADPVSSGAPAPSLSAAELEKLVGPIALYPDDLVAIILPASTYPLHIVQADRFLDKRKANPQLQPDAAWDDSVKSLLNYSDVVKKMSGDLDWTEALGEAVVANNSAVLDAVQAFRRKAQTAGNLKSDAKQTVVVEKEIIKLVPADPQIIYVPQYQPAAVVVAGAPVSYYPTQYPVYHYPYPPGAALATGIIWGAALGAVWNGGRYATQYSGGSINNSNNITINRGGNTVNTGGGNRATNLPANSTGWKPSRQPGQVGRPSTQPANMQRMGDARPGGGYGGAGGAAGTRPAMGGAGGHDGGAFGGMNSGGAAQRNSDRGQSSRASGGFGGGAQASHQGGGFQGGGARAGGGATGGARAGGGAAAGGGARAGGGRRR